MGEFNLPKNFSSITYTVNYDGLNKVSYSYTDPMKEVNALHNQTEELIEHAVKLSGFKDAKEVIDHIMGLK